MVVFDPTKVFDDVVCHCIFSSLVMSCSIDPLKKRSNLLLRNVRSNEKEFARVATWDLLVFDSDFRNENSACLFGKYDQT